jgi:acetyl esterase/lipase
MFGGVAQLSLHPEIAAVVSMIPLPTITADNLNDVRNASLAPPPELSDRVERTEHVVPGSHDITVRVHRPKGVEGPLPCVYSIHGGGYVIGSYDMDDAKFDSWCDRFGIVGVSVEYRLSPETAYPGPLEDCYRGLKWTYDNADMLGVDRDRIGITGVSAGGGLAAGLGLLARDRAEVPLIFQLLDCPMIDDRQATPSSQLDDLVIWSRGSNTFGWQSYLGALYGTDDIPIYAAAARADDLSGLPPTYVCVGAVDGFRDEDIAYATRLNQAGVETELHVYPGAPHGVQLFTHVDVAKQYGRDQADWLGRQLASAAAARA